MTTPLCRARKIIVDTPEGHRVPLGSLFASFTPRERCAWFRWTGTATSDELGLLPDGVESFFEDRERKSQKDLFA